MADNASTGTVLEIKGVVPLFLSAILITIGNLIVHSLVGGA